MKLWSIKAIRSQLKKEREKWIMLKRNLLVKTMITKMQITILCQILMSQQKKKKIIRQTMK